METYTLTREPSRDVGTFGKLPFKTVTFDTIELPWRNNAHGVSCIPPSPVDGYVCTWHNSPNHGWLFLINGVPDRQDILIGHKGNWAGDITLGLRSDFLGCVGLGTGRAVIEGQAGITGSGVAVATFLDLADQEEFRLVIV